MDPIVINDRRHHAKLKNELAAHPIPPMIDPLGKGWPQPPRIHITVDATHALMSLETFNQLLEYSGTFPTGAYPGKMWRRYDGLFDRGFIAAGGKPTWLLCWYGPPKEGLDPEKWVSNNRRKIILIDADIEEITK